MSRSSLLLLALTLLLAAAAALSLVVARDPGAAAGRMLPAFDAQGHRGARGLMPENSLPGFVRALALGVTTLEMDVVMTGDGVLVAHHDRRLDPERTRASDGAWLDPEAPAPLLYELDLGALQAFDLGRLRPGSEAADRFPEQVGLDGLPPPTLSQVLEEAEERSGATIRYNVETKLSPLAAAETPAPEAFAAALVSTLREAGVIERAAIQSFDWRTLAAARARAPELTRVHLTAERDWLDNVERGRAGASPWLAGDDVDAFDGSLPQLVHAAGGDVWSPYWRDLREAELREAHRLGLRVVVWTVNDPEAMASLIDLGVDGIITDYPDRLRRVMADKGLALPPSFPGD